MRYLVIVAVLVVLGGGVLLFATGGDDDAGRTAGATLTETARGGGAQVALAPGNADGGGLPAAPPVSDDAITGGQRSAAVSRETGRDAPSAPADAAGVTATLEEDEEIERRPLAVLQEEDTIERRPLAPQTAEVERREPRVTADGAKAPTETVAEAPSETVAEAPARIVAEAPAETVAEAPTETVAEAPARIVAEASSETVAEAPTETVAEAPARIVAEAPAETVAEAPARIVAEAPARIAAEAPAETVAEAPARIVAEAPTETVAEAPAETVAEAPAETVAEVPAQVAALAPTETVAVERQALVSGGSREVTVRVIESRRLGASSRTVADRRLPGVRGIEARTGRRLETAILPDRTVADAAGRATIEETRTGRTVVAALRPGASAGGLARGAEGVRPTFDVVRISATGNAVIAGRAEPGANVVVLDRGRALGQVKANRRGEWVLVPLEPLPPGATELYVEASLPGTFPRLSENVVVLSVPRRSEPQAARVRPFAVLTPRGGGATRVLQGSRLPVARDKGGPGVSLDVVDYDDAGNIILSGRADPNAEIRVYTDNRLIGTARSDKKGDWQLRPDVRIAPGDHELRVDSVSVEGKVLARSVLPFTRADLQLFDMRDGRVVVQPGNSLWRIARATYGSGLQFTLIYDANREQIHDPDLIFPGQVFKVPEPN